ncbi:RNA polymerase sigma factor [Rhizobium leguminosarum bv. viciae]|uniref:RNA polymerase sigma factor n=1 Tax=Rhizobium leguminosarum TaxID=384 RepID=UPI0010403CF1|nr:RNA polymerase sigma factor [Rhizobium leguminosarum]MBY5340097.1 RNA polymerase sigma factor [Rhizobium leguminosarum]NKK48997.1 sigma-70 family RNA polymerase sigma factor [Rhizobium leguminosarum bv. viciae]TBY99147.1 RNA polymerase sigma factor [Rhizobium leguminosarum bv. viciae]
MTDIAWIDLALASARPKALGALLRYFRNLDTAEEAFQEACLRAIRTWPEKGPPRDPTAWLIFVGRNSGIDAVRKRAKIQALPDEDVISDTEDAESDIVERLDDSNYRDDILRLLFICCHPDLPATQQIALALRIVSGLSVPQIARAFLVSESAMEQRITRAKARVAKAGVPFETPSPQERAERLSIVSTMIYLIFNEGYSQADPRHEAAAFSDEAIRLARLMLHIFPSEPELMGLLALMLLQISRRPARFDAGDEIVLLEDQDRSLWNQPFINEALALLDKALRHRQPAPYQIQAAIAAVHSRAKRAEDTDWVEIDLLYRALERIQPSPVITLNRAVVVSKLHGPQDALDLIDPLGEKLGGYFYYHGLRGGLLKQLGLTSQAREAFDRAIALAHSVAEAAHIRRQIDKMQEETPQPIAK